jgi:hypothetical protein
MIVREWQRFIYELRGPHLGPVREASAGGAVVHGRRFEI